MQLWIVTLKSYNVNKTIILQGDNVDSVIQKMFRASILASYNVLNDGITFNATFVISDKPDYRLTSGGTMTIKPFNIPSGNEIVII